MAQWLASRGYVGLPVVMEAGMVPYGYGDVTVTPAVCAPLTPADIRRLTSQQIYMLQYFTPDVLGAFLGVVPSYIVGTYTSTPQCLTQDLTLFLHRFPQGVCPLRRLRQRSSAHEHGRDQDWCVTRF